MQKRLVKKIYMYSRLLMRETDAHQVWQSFKVNGIVAMEMRRNHGNQ